MEEEWRDVVGYEGLYKISNLGRVMSLYKGTKLRKKVAILKPNIRENGYESVSLYMNKKKRGYLVHRLVAMAFIPNPDNLPAVNHKDECKTNNTPENLEWCTVRYNNCYGTARIRHALTNGRPVIQMNGYRMEIARYKTLSIAEELLGLCSISEAIKGNHKCGGYLWKFADGEY